MASENQVLASTSLSQRFSIEFCYYVAGAVPGDSMMSRGGKSQAAAGLITDYV